MECKYYRDLKHSYAVCECKEQDKKDTRYQLKIMESGKIKGLLKNNLRVINSEKFLYYEISSMMSLENRFESKGMQKNDLLKLFSDMRYMAESLSEFLLGEEGIVFDARNIYVNLATGEYGFMYYPYLTEGKSVGDFLESLLDIVDHEDDQAVELIYDMCDKSQVGDILLIDLLNSVLDKKKSEATNKYIESEHLINEVEDEYGYEDYPEPEEKEENPLQKSNRKLGGQVQIIFSLMFVAVIAGIMYVRMNYILTREENLLSIGVIMVSGITGAIAFYSGIKTIKTPETVVVKPTNKKIIEEDDELDAEEYEEHEEYLNNYKMPIRITSATRDSEQLNVEDSNCDETVVLDIEENREMTLYSRNMDKTIRICLDKLPITIGKMEGCVDKVISDMSISRIHCKFIRDDLGIALVDLGSTNGSYRNGLRLSPQEKTYIDEGDEIKLGRICFDMR